MYPTPPAPTLCAGVQVNSDLEAAAGALKRMQNLIKNICSNFEAPLVQTPHGAVSKIGAILASSSKSSSSTSKT